MNNSNRNSISNSFIEENLNNNKPNIKSLYNRNEDLQFKNEISDLTLAVDIIVGYPTESDEDFDLTVDLLKQIKPSIIHLSKYQHRKGAISSSLKEIPPETMKKRSKFLSEIKSKITEEENQILVNSVQKV